MNNKTRQASTATAGRGVCQGAGPALSDLLRRLGPPAAARDHFEAARIEFLKGIRVLLDARIQQCSQRRVKGEKIRVE
jgi:hypothetical protein